MPPETKAELVGGVVYMPSPMRLDHGGTSRIVSGWLFYYQLHTSGVEGADAATVKLDPKGEPQPDCKLFIPAELGGQSDVDAEGYLAGAPELIIEIARSSRTYDLGAKMADYERAGVREYVVVELDPDRVHWFVRRGDRFEELPAGPDGVYRSEVFPGLWLDPQALFSEDRRRLIEVLDEGLATPQHAAFVARLAEARERPRQS
jgi:Uma2 family endonuclease